jgi:hypothetical protein
MIWVQEHSGTVKLGLSGRTKRVAHARSFEGRDALAEVWRGHGALICIPPLKRYEASLLVRTPRRPLKLLYENS